MTKAAKQQLTAELKNLRATLRNERKALAYMTGPERIYQTMAEDPDAVYYAEREIAYLESEIESIKARLFSL